jgi:hypothetical protein
MFVADDTSQSLVSQMNGVHPGRQADGPHPSACKPLPLHSFYCLLPRAIVPAYRLDQSGNTPVSITIGLTLLELSTNYLKLGFCRVFCPGLLGRHPVHGFSNSCLLSHKNHCLVMSLLRFFLTPPATPHSLLPTALPETPLPA